MSDWIDTIKALLAPIADALRATGIVDWITGVWTKPLATWTLLDILGILILIPLTLFAAFLLLFVGVGIWNEISFRTRRLRSPRESHEAMRKRMGYDK